MMDKPDWDARDKEFQANLKTLNDIDRPYYAQLQIKRLQLESDARCNLVEPAQYKEISGILDAYEKDLLDGRGTFSVTDIAEMRASMKLQIDVVKISHKASQKPAAQASEVANLGNKGTISFVDNKKLIDKGPAGMN